MKDYKKLYEDAIEKIRNGLQPLQDGSKVSGVTKGFLEEVFPELCESEDEEIRKSIIAIINNYVDNSNTFKPKMLAWLEKQESYYTFEIKEGHWYKCVCDYMLNGSDLMFKNGRLYYCRSNWRLSGEIDERNVKDIGVNGYKSFFRPATNQEIKDWLEKQGDFKSIDSDDLATLEIWEDFIKENKEKWQLSDWFVEATSLLIQKVKG